MSDKRQEFTNNFNNYENTRFDFGIAMLMTLFSKENQDMINKKIKEQLFEFTNISTLILYICYLFIFINFIVSLQIRQNCGQSNPKLGNEVLHSHEFSFNILCRCIKSLCDFHSHPTEIIRKIHYICICLSVNRANQVLQLLHYPIDNI